MPYFLLFSQLLPRTKNNILLGNFGDYFQPLLKQKNFRTIKSNNIKIPDNCDNGSEKMPKVSLQCHVSMRQGKKCDTR